MSELPTTTWGTESDANRIKKTYVKGFMDVSGGELSVHNTAFNVFNSDGSGVFRINPRKITVKDDTGQEVDISLSYLTFLNNLVPADGQAVSIPEKVKYIFTVGTETNIGKSIASSNFRVYGNTYVEENLFVSKDASFGQRFLLMGDASLNSNLYVLSKTRLGNDLSLNGNFTMYGDASLNGRLMLSGDASLNGNLYVLSKTRLGNDLSLNGNLFLYGGDASLNGRLMLSGDASLNGNLYVLSKTRLGNDLSLNGNFTMYGDASLNGRLMLSGDASLNGNLYVLSKTRLGNDLSLNGNFTMYGDASLNGRLMLSGDAYFNSNLYVLSKTRLGNDLSLNGNFTMYGDASLNGRLMLSGDASFNSNLYVLSKTRLGNDLSLNGNFTMYGDASINGLLLVSKDASLNGNVYVRGRTTFYEPSGSVITSSSSRGTLNLTHGDASGGSSILFQSVNSANNDYAYIQYQENVPYAGQTTTTESGLLTIGIENDISGVNRDRIALISANGSGNVGVNTKFPNYNLDVSGNCVITSGTADENPSLTIIKDTGIAADWFNVWQHRGQLEVKESSGHSMSFSMSTDGVGIIHAKRFNFGYYNVCINPQTPGNVGIGTLAPAYKLDVSGSINTNNIIRLSEPTGSYYGEIYSSNQNLIIKNNGNGWTFIRTQNNINAFVMNKEGYAAFNTEPNGSYRLDVSGSLRAGATTISTFTTAGIVHNAANGSLSSSLIVDGDITTNTITYAKMQNVATGNRVLGSSSNGGTVSEVQVATGMIADDAVTTIKIANGNITTAKLANLTGTVNFENITASGNITANVTITAFSFNATSDYRVKTDVKPLDASFNVDVLKPVTYTNTRHGRKDVGFIAHEVHEHYPFLVSGEKDGEHMQSLNYIGLIGILTKEIQDLKRRLAETEAKVASVETDVRTIDTKVEEVGDIIISVEDTVLSVKNQVSSVENKVSSVENKVSSVENTVLLEQARLTICETDVALNKSAIRGLDERFQS